MRTSESISELATALSAAQGEFTSPERNREVKVTTKAGGEYRFWYSTLDCVMDMARPILAKHGLAVTQPPTVKDGAVVVLTRLMHSSGQYQEEEIAVVPEEFGPQQIGSAVTYMKRYAYCGMLGIASDEDDDGNAASGNQVQESRGKQPKPACPECGKPGAVYEDRNKGGFFCWKAKGGCGHNWLPESEQPKSEPKNGAKAKADEIAAEHGMTTADKVAPPPKPTFEAALEFIDEVARGFEQLDAAASLVLKRHVEKKLTKQQYADLNDRLCRRAIELVHFAPDVPKAKEFIDSLHKAKRIDEQEQLAYWTSLAGAERALTAGAAA